MTTKMKRRPLSREMLLPLPTHKARALSLEYHLALSVLASAHGELDQAAKLMQAVCHARFLAGADESDVNTLRDAQLAFEALVERVEAGAGWTVTDVEREAIAGALNLHDRLTAREPYYRFLDAWTQMLKLGRKLAEPSA